MKITLNIHLAPEELGNFLRQAFHEEESVPCMIGGHSFVLHQQRSSHSYLAEHDDWHYSSSGLYGAIFPLEDIRRIVDACGWTVTRADGPVVDVLAGVAKSHKSLVELLEAFEKIGSHHVASVDVSVESSEETLSESATITFR